MTGAGGGGHLDGKFAYIDSLAIDGGFKAHVHSCEKAERAENTGEEQKGQGTWDEGQDKCQELSDDVWLCCGLGRSGCWMLVHELLHRIGGRHGCGTNQRDWRIVDKTSDALLRKLQRLLCQCFAI